MKIAIITARGGSKGLPGKNVKVLNGHPLIAYTIKAAQDSDIFERVIVSTDCTEIAAVSKTYGAEVLARPKELAEDNTSSYDVVAHVLEIVNDERDYSHFMLLQPTSPLRTARHIQEAVDLYDKNDYSSLVSITETEITPFKCFVEDKDDSSIKPLFGWEELTMPRQKLPKTYLVNGAIYLCEIKSFLRDKSFFSQVLGVYKMSVTSSIDIDTIDDFVSAEKILNQ